MTFRLKLQADILIAPDMKEYTLKDYDKLERNADLTSYHTLELAKIMVVNLAKVFMDIHQLSQFASHIP